MTEPTLASLRAVGAHQLDPARFCYLEALARRIDSQPDAVQRILQSKLQQAVDAYAALVRTPGTSQEIQSPVAAGVDSTPSPSPLLQLNRYIAARTQTELARHPTEDGGSSSDMKSVRRFSEVWSKVAAEQRVVQAVERGPENAGPLNSHRLMLRSLTLMRELSPDYLGRFLAQMEALLWLDQVNQQTSLKDAKAKRPSRAKK